MQRFILEIDILTVSLVYFSLFLLVKPNTSHTETQLQIKIHKQVKFSWK